MSAANGKHRSQTLPHMWTKPPPSLRTFSLDLDGNRMTARAPIARGGFSDVFRMLVPKYGVVAVKRLRFNDTERDDLEAMVAKEAQILTMIDHPHILRFLGISYMDGAVCIVSPWADNGPLSSYLVRKPNADRLGLLAQVASALSYLHTNVGDIIIHGDLHVDNVLISHMETALLSDFGLSRIVPEGNSSSLWRGDSNDCRIGRVVYEAPELHEGARRSWATDVFAFGMLIFHAFSGKQPFAKARNYMAAVVALFEGRRPDRAEIRRGDFSDCLWQLVCQCWDQCPQSRPRMPQVTLRMEALLKERNRLGVNVAVSMSKTPVYQSSCNGTVGSVPLQNIQAVSVSTPLVKLPPKLPRKARARLGAGQYRWNCQNVLPFLENSHDNDFALQDNMGPSYLIVQPLPQSLAVHPENAAALSHRSHAYGRIKIVCLIVLLTRTATSVAELTIERPPVIASVGQKQRRGCRFLLSKRYPFVLVSSAMVLPNQSRLDMKMPWFILIDSHSPVSCTKRQCPIPSLPFHSTPFSRCITLADIAIKFDGVVGKAEWESSDIGARYKPGERITGVVARALVSPRVRLLDNACGTGIVAHEFHAAVVDNVDYKVTCADFSDGMVETVGVRAKMEGWSRNVVKADAQETKLPTAQFTHVLTSLGFGIFPDSDAALNEIDRILVPGGALGLTTWTYIGWPALLQRGLSLAGCTSIVLLDLLATSLARTGYDWSSPEAIVGILTSRGYTDIAVRVLSTSTEFSKAEIVDGDMGHIPLNIITSLVPAEERGKIKCSLLCLSTGMSSPGKLEGCTRWR